MIQFETVGMGKAFHPARARRFGLYALTVYPVGFLCLLAGTRFHAAAWLGGILMLSAFMAALSLIPTRVQRIAAGVEHGLDEFELDQRLRAQSTAYRWFTLFVVLLCCYADLAAGFGLSMSTSSTAFSAVVFWMITYSLVMPAYFLARQLPKSPED